MKTTKLTKPRNSFMWIVNPHILGAVIIAVIISLLMLAGCATVYNQRAYKSDLSDCEVLMKKRYTNIKASRQPKIHQRKVNAKTIDPAAKSVEIVALAPQPKDQVYAPLQIIETAADKLLPDHLTPPTYQTRQYPSVNQTSDSHTESKVSVDVPKPALALREVNSFPDSFMYFGLMIGAPALISLLLLRVFTPSSIKISAWAAHHPRTSRGIIGGIHLGSCVTGLIAGNYFAQQGILLGDGLTASAAGGFIAASLLYPNGVKSLNRFTANYFRQKFHDVVLCSTGVALSLSAGNHLATPHSYVQHRSYQSIPIVINSIQDGSLHDADLLEEAQQDPPEKKNGKITITILASLLFLVGILGVAALSCSLSCSGFGTGAVLVGILGGAGMILALVAMLKNIRKKYKVKSKKTKVAEPSEIKKE